MSQQWSTVVPRTSAQLAIDDGNGEDPYFEWAWQTRWRGYDRGAGKPGLDDASQVPIIALAKDENALSQLIACSHAPASPPPLLTIPQVYGQPVPGSNDQSAMWFTATVPRGRLSELVGMPELLAWELAVPRRDAETAASSSRLGYFGDIDSFSLREKTPARLPAHRAGAASQAMQGKLQQVIAVVDFGCPFLNEQFLAHSSAAAAPLPRVKALWDQGWNQTSTQTPWVGVPGFDSGRALYEPQLEALATRLRPNGKRAALDEATLYKRIDYLIAYDDDRRRVWYATHGAAVLSVAAGNTDPLTGEAGDAAVSADLVFVNLPALTASDSSGASLSANLLDAVRFVLSCCEPQAPIVINVSYGSHAGPHDGSAMIERALDELLSLRSRNFAIVLGAGNARQARCHARRTVRADKPARLIWELAAGDTTDTFMEVWYPVPWPGPGLKARVRTAQGDWSAWVAAGCAQWLRDSDSDEVVGGILHRGRVPNGARSMLVLALVPTAKPKGQPGALAVPGEWEIELALADESPDAAAIIVQAWIERDDPGALVVGEQSHFLSQELTDSNGTLSSIATGQHTIAAGGFRISSGEAVSYSALGERPREQPPVYAACEEDDVHQDIRAAAVRSMESRRMNGTSVAAPVLVRRLFNYMVSSKRPVEREDWPEVMKRLAARDPAIRLPA